MYDVNAPEKLVQIDIEPVGRRVSVRSGTTILEAAQQGGIELVAVCGGIGICETCRVQILQGATSPPTPAEQIALTETDLEMGFRLACQTAVLEDSRIHIPPESLAAPQRLQVEGLDEVTTPQPAVMAVDLKLTRPDLYDLRSDAARLSDALASRGIQKPELTVPVLSEVSHRFRQQNWEARVVLGQQDAANELIAVLPSGTPLFGAAFDIGTTKLAGYLVDLESGVITARAGAMNPQIAFGEDIVSRIAYANRSDSNLSLLRSRLIETLNDLTGELCLSEGIERSQVVDLVAVGNTVIHHVFAGLPVRQLGEVPFVPVTSDPLYIPARELGFEVAPGARMYLPPLIAGYVGADHTAMLLATRIRDAEGIVMALDIGTNTEISLVAGNDVWSCSCASGPAFEGAHIKNGVRAIPGAIERVRAVEGEFRVHTIQNLPPTGICGSGILDAVAALRSEGLLDNRGSLLEGHPRVRKDGKSREFVLAHSTETGHGHDLVVTRADVHEIQLAKGAIRTGIELLLKEAGIDAANIERLDVAGAFGTYLSVTSAIEIGMFPDLPLDRFQQVGNAAGMGAVQMLISNEKRTLAIESIRDIRYIELTTHPAFEETFVESLFL